MNTSEFNFELPKEKIAQFPIEPRDESKLLVCKSAGRAGDFQQSFGFENHQFKDVLDLLDENDFLVFNNAKVLPVRLLGRRAPEGGAVEILLIKKLSAVEWTGLLHLSAKIKTGMQFDLGAGLMAEVLSSHEERIKNAGEVRLKFFGIEQPVETWLAEFGHVPLPPYIDRQDEIKDKQTYQTVYAEKEGSAAAPTAGFHFTALLMERLRMKGIEFGMVTLHVGLGTFRPMKVENIADHEMHEEHYEISEEFLEKFKNAKLQGKRIVAVGTTVVRALESWLLSEKNSASGKFSTNIFIQPGFRFQAIDDLITNFHLPKSTLLVLVAAVMGLENMKKSYEWALASGYRFFSYGDAMLIRGR